MNTFIPQSNPILWIAISTTTIWVILILRTNLNCQNSNEQTINLEKISAILNWSW